LSWNEWTRTLLYGPNVSSPHPAIRRTLSAYSTDTTAFFTGDTYYPGPIWLNAPETNLEAYGASIKRLAVLVPSVKMVFGAHNAPVASPSVLPRLVAAFEAVRGGTISATPEAPGKAPYKVDDFSFVMSSPKP